MYSEKQVSYTTTNTYATLNTLQASTKNVWLVFHGMGYLSKYFIRYFDGLDPNENFIIAPQAPSKYYQGKNFKHVGASWLTRERTKDETKNVLAYIDGVASAELNLDNVRFIVMGYSQGVSIATRWLSSRKIQCDTLLLHSGAIPVELTSEDFTYLKPECEVIYLYGTKDQYITEARKTEEELKGNKLFGDRLEIETFDGIHEIHPPSLVKMATKL
jgi:predicted esterase